MPDAPSQSQSSLNLLSANSQPFVPASKQDDPAKAGREAKQRSPVSNVNAKPFIPAGANGSTPPGTRKMSGNAAPYIPTQPSPPRPSNAQSSPSPSHNQSYQRYPPNKSPEASRARGRSLSKPDLRYPETSEYAMMGPGYNAMPMPSNMSGGPGTLVEPSYAMGPSPARPPLRAYPPAYPMGREQSSPSMPMQQPILNRLPAIRPQQRPPADASGRGLRPRNRGAGGMMPGQPPPHFAGHAAMANSMPVLARMHQAASMASDQLLTHLQSRQYLIQQQASPEALQELGLSEMVMDYHSIANLEEPKQKDAMSKSLGVSSLVFKGISMHDGEAYAIRRISWHQVPPSAELSAHADSVVEAWNGVALHPNVSVPRHAFVALDTTGQPVMHIVHNYYPAASTLEAAHLQPQVTANGLVQMSASEEMVWSYLLQIASAIGAIHAVGLACRAALHPSKLLLLPGGHIRLGNLGVAEILAGLSTRHDDVALLQQEDLRLLGTLLLQLLCGSFTHPSLDHVSAHYSPDLTHIVASLTGHSEPFNSWHQLASVLWDRAFTELNLRTDYSVAITNAFSQEVENGRLLRLMVKLTSVLERADTSSEFTGDRYMLQLFRDFVFHQPSEDGSATISWSHTMECLNKLDAGVSETIILMSRDEKSMLVVTYADMKRCLENTLSDQKRRAMRSHVY